MERLRISTSISLHNESREDPVEYFAKGLYFLRDIGFDAGDMPSFFFRAAGDAPEKAVERIHAAAEDSGVQVELCHLPFGMDDLKTDEEKALFSKRMYKAMDVAKMLGVKYSVVHPFAPLVPISEYDEKKQRELVMKDLAPVAEYANKIGLTIVLENMRYAYAKEGVRRYCCTAEQICSVVDEFGMGICWDFGHAHVKGQLQSEWLSYMGKRIKMLHVHDNYPTVDAHVAPFLGKIDWQDAMQGLKKIGYQGLLNYEVDTHHVPPVAREDYARMLVKIAHTLLDMME